MTSPVADPVRDVTLLMMVRAMPEEDFRSLCERILQGDATTEDATLSSALYLNAGERGRTPENKMNVCSCCGGPCEDEPLNRACEQGLGVRACKSCIDGGLGAAFGPDPEPGSELNPLLRRVLVSMATGHAPA